MSWLDPLVFAAYRVISYLGVAAPSRQRLNFIGSAVTVADNPTTEATDVTINTVGAAVELSPSGGPNDAAIVEAAWQALPEGGTLRLLGGNWPWNTPCDLTGYNNRTLELSPDTTIAPTLTPGGGGNDYSQSAFITVAVEIGPATTLSSGLAIGDVTAVLVGDPGAIGSVLKISDAANNRAQIFTITSKSGSGPYTVGLDLPAKFAFASGKDAVCVVPPTLTIRGNGASIVGTGDRAVEISCGQDCLVQDLYCSGFSSLTLSQDVGGRRNTFRRILVNGAGIARVGVALESQTDSTIEDCFAWDCDPAGLAGILVLGSKGCNVVRSLASGGHVGINLDYSSGSDLEGCLDCNVAQCFAENTGDAGVLVNGGSGVRFSQTSITKATADGFAIQGASVSLSQSRVTGCGSTAVHAADDAHSNHSTVHVIGLESSGNAADFLAGTSSVIYTATESVVGGSPPAPTPTIIAGLGSTGTVTVEAGSNDLAGVILLNPGGSGIANYAIIHLAFSATLPGNTPVVTPSLEDGAANWGAGSSLGLSTVHVTGRANDGFEVTALNARWDNVSAVVGVTLAAGSNQYRIPYRVALK